MSAVLIRWEQWMQTHEDLNTSPATHLKWLRTECTEVDGIVVVVEEGNLEVCRRAWILENEV